MEARRHREGGLTCFWSALAGCWRISAKPVPNRQLTLVPVKIEEIGTTPRGLSSLRFELFQVCEAFLHDSLTRFASFHAVLEPQKNCAVFL